MATVKKGILTRAGEWWTHLRPYGKREFWKGERRAADADAREQIDEDRAAKNHEYDSYLVNARRREQYKADLDQALDEFEADAPPSIMKEEPKKQLEEPK
jgi:hypothetical protein